MREIGGAGFSQRNGTGIAIESNENKVGSRMKKAIIPWHVFQEGIETLNPNALNIWLERWRFMDDGVVLFEASLPAPDPHPAPSL